MLWLQEAELKLKRQQRTNLEANEKILQIKHKLRTNIIFVQGLISHRIQQVVVILLQSAWVLEEIGQVVGVQVTEAIANISIIESFELISHLNL